MNVYELRNLCNELIIQGHRLEEAQIFDADAWEWCPITGVVYGHGDPVRFYSDDIS